ncbi:MAG: hypothetical protein ACKVOE_00680 [Rickettsiales bacterium]
MAILATGLPVNTASSLPQAAPAAASTALPGQNVSVARLILPQAVTGPVASQAFSANIAQPPKPVIRGATNAAASPLAAQFIAQDAANDDETLAIFNPPPPPPPAPESEARAFIDTLRQARGDAPSPANNTTPAATPPAAPSPASLAAQPIRINTAALSQPAAPSPASLLSPAPRVNNVVRKPGLADSTGPEAYRIANIRNDGPATNLFVVG